MTNENTTTQAPAATLTEKELFAEFADSTILDAGRPTPVSQFFTGQGETDRFSDAMLAAFEDILSSDKPAAALDAVSITLKGLLHEVNYVAAQFEMLKFGRSIDMDDEPVRYSLPEAA